MLGLSKVMAERWPSSGSHQQHFSPGYSMTDSHPPPGIIQYSELSHWPHHQEHTFRRQLQHQNQREDLPYGEHPSGYSTIPPRQNYDHVAHHGPHYNPSLASYQQPRPLHLEMPLQLPASTTCYNCGVSHHGSENCPQPRWKLTA